MVDIVENVLITGITGRFGREFVRQHAGKYNFIGISRHKGLDLGSGISELIDIDLAERNLSDLLLERFRAFPKINYVINAAADTKFYVSRSSILCSSSDVENQFWINVIVPSIVIAALFETQLKDRPVARNSVSVLNISSESAYTVHPNSGQSFYAASKSALNSLTLHLAQEYSSYNMIVNGFAPGNFSDDARCNQVVKAAEMILHSKESGRIYRM